MPSKLFDTEISNLVRATEVNIKKIERYNGDFVCVALNEWRYATRHVVDMDLSDPSDENRTQAVRHFKRAYFDSSDILLDCLLEKLEDLHLGFRDYASIVQRYVKDYPDKMKLARAAKEFHRDAEDMKNREESYRTVSGHCDMLESFIEELEDTSVCWRPEIAKAIRSDRMKFWGFIIGAATLGVSIVSLFLK